MPESAFVQEFAAEVLSAARIEPIGLSQSPFALCAGEWARLYAAEARIAKRFGVPRAFVQEAIRATARELR